MRAHTIYDRDMIVKGVVWCPDNRNPLDVYAEDADHTIQWLLEQGYSSKWNNPEDWTTTPDQLKDHSGNTSHIYDIGPNRFRRTTAWGVASKKKTPIWCAAWNGEWVPLAEDSSEYATLERLHLQKEHVAVFDEKETADKETADKEVAGDVLFGETDKRLYRTDAQEALARVIHKATTLLVRLSNKEETAETLLEGLESVAEQMHKALTALKCWGMGKPYERRDR